MYPAVIGLPNLTKAFIFIIQNLLMKTEMALLSGNIIEKAHPKDFEEITAVWEASVRATHLF